MEPRPFERWCLDRRSAGERPLTPGERHRLARLRRHLGWKFIQPWSVFAAYWAVLFTIAPNLLAGSDWVRGAGLLFLMIGMLLLLPITILVTRDLWNERTDVTRDLRTDRVERFEPVIVGSPLDVEGIIEARHPSTRIVTGPKILIDQPWPIRVVAPGPIIGMRVTHPAEGLPEGARLERRHLSPEEQDELVRSIARVEKLPAVEWLGAIWCVVCVGAWVAAKKPLPLSSYIALAQGLFCGGWFLWAVFRSHSLARQMRADVEDGFAIVFVPPDPNASAEEEGLPHSGLTWRIAGMPAEWRGGDLMGLGRS